MTREINLITQVSYRTKTIFLISFMVNCTVYLFICKKWKVLLKCCDGCEFWFSQKWIFPKYWKEWGGKRLLYLLSRIGLVDSSHTFVRCGKGGSHRSSINIVTWVASLTYNPHVYNRVSRSQKLTIFNFWKTKSQK